MVVSGERLLGIITLKDMLQFLSLKMELEENGFVYYGIGRKLSAQGN